MGEWRRLKETKTEIMNQDDRMAGITHNLWLIVSFLNELSSPYQFWIGNQQTLYWSLFPEWLKVVGDTFAKVSYSEVRQFTIVSNTTTKRPKQEMSEEENDRERRGGLGSKQLFRRRPSVSCLWVRKSNWVMENGEEGSKKWRRLGCKMETNFKLPPPQCILKES